MFERAALFSALLIFISLGILGLKYLEFMEAKAQGNSNALTTTQ